MKSIFFKTSSMRIAGLVFGLASVIGVSANASASSDYKVIARDKIAMGDWKHHKSWRVLRFYLPRNFDHNSDVILQMNVRSTNKSKYNAIYLNDFSVDEFGGCDPVENDPSARSRIDYLPMVPHNQWRVYHRTIRGKNFKSGNNYLLVCSRNSFGDSDHHIDNFYLKDVVVHYRERAPRPEFCSPVFEPVCGVDGFTYGSACEAARDEVEIQYEGSCED